MPLESSNVVAQAESWQVQVLVNANCSPLTASALNDNETVVGRCRLPNNSLSAYRWTNGVLTVLPTTMAHSDAFAVNNSGQVVGELVLRWPGSPRAFVWSADGVVTVRQTGDGRRETGDGSEQRSAPFRGRRGYAATNQKLWLARSLDLREVEVGDVRHSRSRKRMS